MAQHLSDHQIDVADRSVEQRVAEWMEPRLPSFVDELRAWAAVDSGSHNVAGVDRMGDLVADRLAQLGFTVERHPTPSFGAAVVARRSGRGAHRVMLLGHLDTVYPDGTAALRPMRVEADHVTGPGVSDMKGGILAALHAVEALLALGLEPFGELVFACTPDEEHPEQECQPLLLELGRAVDVALTLESGRANGDIVCERKAGYVWRLDVHGRSAHAGVEPENGRSAILQLAHTIVGLHALADATRGTTINVGLVSGGSASNAVPDSATATFEARARTTAELERVEQGIAELLATTVVPDVTFELTQLVRCPPMECTVDVEHLVALARAGAASLGWTLGAASTGGGSDASFVAGAGIPVLDGLGPVGGLDHSPDEYLDLSSVAPRTALLAGLIARIDRDGPRAPRREEVGP
ncbi:MAG: M20 family metallopeptidase [Actinobacteria bacterium]|nr:M20 family metallopeptidase [Actinomycetota bacterium]